MLLSVLGLNQQQKSVLLDYFRKELVLRRKQKGEHKL